MTTRFDQGPWAEPGAETVRPGVHRVPLPLPGDGLRAVNVYLLEDPAGDGGIVMVDGGWAIPEARKALEKGMAAVGRDLGDIGHILVTHIHRDHYTHAVELRRLLGARVYLGMGERPGLEMLHRLRSDEPASSLETLRRAGGGELAERIRAMDHGRHDPAVWQPPDRWLDAETVRFDDALSLEPPEGARWIIAIVKGERVMDDALPFMPIQSLAFTNPVYLGK